jgi:hypothetical protein
MLVRLPGIPFFVANNPFGGSKVVAETLLAQPTAIPHIFETKYTMANDGNIFRQLEKYTKICAY